MTTDALLDGVEDIVADVLQVGRDEFDDETVFGEDVPAESLDLIEIAETIAFEYDVTVPDEALEEVDTVGDLKAYVREHA